ncbi:hypothetical protein VP1G_09355 [Cytospora mali]|uniref:Uncharacterized protein n=1 Tax=Cytospora mali TaxID=578113 RepID=A0A194VE03_CYTMA|nr:hypothetical protein VP1G_09355 [Valsa mali var. pyri (nom. inval.)]
MSTLLSFLLIQALHVVLTLADPFNITVIEAGTNGGTASYRVWYGDGQAYVGPNVPETVEQAIDITSPGTVDEILYIEATGSSTPTSNTALSQSTSSSYFMAINTSSTASDPVYFTDSLSSLPSDAVHRWTAYSGYLLPVTDSGSLLQAPSGGGAYLVPVDGVDDTYSLRWIMDADVATSVGGSKVLLSSLPVLAVASSS